MRLSQEQTKCLVDATHSCFGSDATISLFGSRIYDDHKGGDIDLYIETSLTDGTVAAKLQLRSMIWPLFGEQKIDILVRSRQEEMNAMHKIAKATCIKLG